MASAFSPPLLPPSFCGVFWRPGCFFRAFVVRVCRVCLLFLRCVVSGFCLGWVALCFLGCWPCHAAPWVWFISGLGFCPGHGFFDRWLRLWLLLFMFCVADRIFPGERQTRASSFCLLIVSRGSRSPLMCFRPSSALSLAPRSSFCFSCAAPSGARGVLLFVGLLFSRLALASLRRIPLLCSLLSSFPWSLHFLFCSRLTASAPLPLRALGSFPTIPRSVVRLPHAHRVSSPGSSRSTRAGFESASALPLGFVPLSFFFHSGACVCVSCVLWVRWACWALRALLYCLPRCSLAALVAAPCLIAGLLVLLALPVCLVFLVPLPFLRFCCMRPLLFFVWARAYLPSVRHCLVLPFSRPVGWRCCRLPFLLPPSSAPSLLSSFRAFLPSCLALLGPVCFCRLFFFGFFVPSVRRSPPSGWSPAAPAPRSPLVSFTLSLSLLRQVSADTLAGRGVRG